MWRGWHMYDGDWWWWGMGLQMLFWILLALILVWFLVRLLKKQDSHRESQDALQALKMRLAKGEISKEEFNETKELLK